MNNIQLIIPMAGTGSRFQEAGYSILKPFLPVGKSTMIETVLNNLNSKLIEKIILVCRSDQNSDVSLYDNLLKIKKVHIVFIDAITDGPATTCYLARNLINHDAPLIIANSDQFLDIDMHQEYLNWSDFDDGYIWCMEDLDTKWSYILTTTDGFVTQVQEKKVISNLATCGVYGFNKAKYFFDSFIEMRDQNDRTNGELYVAPVYNYLIRQKLKIKSKNLGPMNKIMYGLGTPLDYELFISLNKLGKFNLLTDINH